MNGRLERAAALFLVPEASARNEAPAVPAAERTLVVGAERDAPALAAAVALTLRAAAGSRAAVVAVWSAAGDVKATARKGIATPAAARVAARLARRELVTAARGRLVWLALPADPPAATRAAHDAAAAVRGCPLVVALAGARPAALDELVEDHDTVIVAAGPTTPLAAAALATLADRPVSALACAPLPRGAGRALALAGLAAPRLHPPLRAVRSADA